MTEGHGLDFIRVVSRRTDGVRARPTETAVYIGRPSVLGNPFPITKESSRRSAIKKYSVWLKQEIARHGPVRAAIEDLVAKVMAKECIALECWCAPLPCHGDVIKEVVLNRAAKRKSNPILNVEGT